MNEKTKELSYARQLILWALSDGCLTADGASKKTGLSRGSINVNLRGLMKDGLIYVCGAVKTTGREAPIYASHKVHSKPNKHLGGRDKKTSKTKEIICDALKVTPMTKRELVSFTGLSMSQIHGCIAHWREVSGTRVFRFSGWKYEDGQGVGYLPVLCLGPGPDAPKPAVSRRERDQRWRDRNRSVIRARSAMDRAKAKGEKFEVNPFAQLLSVTGATLSAAKQKAKIQAEMLEAA